MQMYKKFALNLTLKALQLNIYDFYNNLSLYLGINNLTDLFSNQEFLIIFWASSKFLLLNLKSEGCSLEIFFILIYQFLQKLHP